MRQLTAKALKQKKVPGVLIMGMLAAMAMGWEANNLMKTKDIINWNRFFRRAGWPRGSLTEIICIWKTGRV